MNKIPVAGLLAIGHYLDQMLSEYQAAASCNDVEPSVFAALSDQEKTDLLADFNCWNKLANPDGWEPTIKLTNVHDFSWRAYFMHCAQNAITSIQ